MSTPFESYKHLTETLQHAHRQAAVTALNACGAQLDGWDPARIIDLDPEYYTYDNVGNLPSIEFLNQRTKFTALLSKHDKAFLIDSEPPLDYLIWRADESPTDDPLGKHMEDWVRMVESEAKVLAIGLTALDVQSLRYPYYEDYERKWGGDAALVFLLPDSPPLAVHMKDLNYASSLQPVQPSKLHDSGLIPYVEQAFGTEAVVRLSSTQCDILSQMILTTEPRVKEFI